MPQLDFPDSPTSGAVYVAPNGITYVYNTSVGTGIWTATVTAGLAVAPGSITGTAQVGSTLTYVPGSASGGTPPYAYTQQWKADGTPISGATSLTYVVVAGDAGKSITVTLTATDSSAPPVSASATTAPTAAVVPSTIPTLSYNPTPSTGPAASNTVATGTWNGTADTLSSTGCIEISVNAGAYSQGPIAVANGNQVDMRWVSSGPCTGAANGTVITGTLTAVSGGTNTYSLTVSTAATGFSFTDLTAQARSTVVTSAVITIAGTNVNTFLTTTGGTLTVIEASIAGGAFAAIPASGTSMPVQPGQTIQIRGTTGAAVSTGYTAILALGTATTTWTATTVAAVPTVTTPSITAPTNGATNLNPADNTPAGLTATSSAFASSDGAGNDHVSSDWEFSTSPTFATISFSVMGTTTQLVSVLIPQANLVVSTTYYVRVRYTSGTGGGGVATTSSYSAGSSFTTASSFAITPGTAMGGGYFGGQIDDGGTVYNLIVAPVATGQYGGAPPTTIQYKTSQSADTNPNSQNQVYGKLATDQFNDAAHPAFQWAKGLTIGGNNDWYIPAKNELEILYFNLKPDTTANDTSSGINPNAVPARASNYTAGTPPQTTNTLFQTGGTEAFSPPNYFWSSSELSSNTLYAWGQIFSGGNQNVLGKDAIDFYARAVRRIAA